MVLDKMCREGALPSNISRTWNAFAKKMISILNLMVIPRVSSEVMKDMLGMSHRFEDTIRDYNEAENMIKYVGSTSNVQNELVNHAHEYVLNNGESFGRTTKTNMFSILTDFDELL